MESTSNSNGKNNKGHIFLEEWKMRRKEDEEKFLRDLEDPQFQKELNEIRGKVVRNGKIISISK